MKVTLPVGKINGRIRHLRNGFYEHKNRDKWENLYKNEKIILIMAIAAMGLGACEAASRAAEDRQCALTAEEIAAGRSPRGHVEDEPCGRCHALARRTDAPLPADRLFDLAENRGVTTLHTEDMDTKVATCLTDGTSNSLAPRWSADGQKIYFLSDRSGSMQVWEMDASGGDARRLTGSGEGEGVPCISPAATRRGTESTSGGCRLRTADRRSAEIYKDMDKSKARIYDDLMVRHWDYWDEGEYRTSSSASFGPGVEGRAGTSCPTRSGTPAGPLLRHGRDRLEPRRNDAGLHLQTADGHRLRRVDRFDIFVYDLETARRRTSASRRISIRAKKSTIRRTTWGYDKYPRLVARRPEIAFLSQRRAGNESDKARLFLYDCHTAQMQDLTEDFDYNAHERRLER